MAGHSGHWARGRARAAAALAVVMLAVPCGCTTGRFHHRPAPPAGREGTTAGLVAGFADPRAYVASVAFGPDGKTVFTDSGPDGGISQWGWSPGAGRRLRALGSPDHSLMAGLAVSADGRLVASADQRGRAWAWNVATGQPVATVAAPHGVSGIALSPDGAMLATFDSRGMISLWSIGARPVPARPQATITVRSRDVRDVTFSPDGAMLAASDVSGVELWDVAAGRLAGSLTDARNGGAGDYARYTPDGKRLVTLGVSGGVNIADVWDLAAGKVIATLSNGAAGLPAGDAGSLAVSPDGTSVAVPYHDGLTVVYSAGTGRPALTLTDPGLLGDRSDATAAFSPDGTLIAVTTGVLGQVFIWNIKQAKGT